VVPERIGRYIIQAELGRGGMGVVYRAQDPQVQRLVALKTLIIADPQQRARFRREVWAAGRLIHPHIVTLFDAGQEGDTAFIVMELIQGETLAERMGEGSNWRQVVTLLAPIAQALHYAHSQGVIHRDLKPANILITREGIPKLSDFGLAQVAAQVALTPQGAAVGTPGYIAPEGLRGEQIDGRADLFSLGVILFEAVSGQHPFAADSVSAMLGQIASDEPVNLEPLTGKAPPALAQAIGRALAKDPQARYATGELLAAALASCLSEKAVELYTPTPDAPLQMHYAPGISLSDAELTLLARAFAGSGEALVEREFDAGFSAARVLLVRPGGGQAQAVVKLGPPADLRREWEAYRALVKDFLPQNTAQIQREPVLADDEQCALLRYTFAGGDPRHPTTSLRDYYEERGGAAAAEVLNRVIRVFGRQWWTRNYPRSFALGQEYDRLLPVHLELDVSDATEISRLVLAAGQANVSALRNCRPGQSVHLLNFTVSEVRPERDELTLTAPPPAGEASAYLRLHVTGIDATAHRPGHQIALLDAVVTATRHSRLVETVETASPGLDPETHTLRLGTAICPNPLRDYPELLDCVTEARWSIIHGDMNLENILVDGETGFAWLIDFAATRHGPALYDLQRLEAQVITKLLPPVVDRAGLGADVMVDLYGALYGDAPDPTAPQPALQEPYTLLAALRRLARQFLMDDLDWSEYYRGLALTLLGTLKFAELGPTARALAFGGAAMARGMMNTPPTIAREHQARPARLRWTSVILASLLVAALLAGWLLWPRSSATPQRGEPLALIAGVTGQAEVRRQADERVLPATFGMELYSEDAVLTYEAAAADVLCQNGWLLHVGPEATLIVRCPEDGDRRAVGRLDPQVGERLFQATDEMTFTLPADATRATPAEWARRPLLLSPRNTVITDTRPAFAWQAVAGASGYRLSLHLPDGQTWSRETAETRLLYPSNAPPLAPGSANVVTLATLDVREHPRPELGSKAQSNDDETAGDKTLLHVLDVAGQAELAEARAAIRGLGLDAATQGYLLAQLYRGWEMWAAAIAQLEWLAEAQAISSADLWQQLGNLYFEVGLYAQAEENYKAALIAAEAADDKSAQAAAHVGLGRVAYAFEESGPALDHLTAAEQLYRQAGEIERANLVAAERVRLEQ